MSQPSIDSQLRTELFKLIERAMFHYPDPYYIDKALDNLVSTIIECEQLAEYRILTELQEWEQIWHDTHPSTEPFNYYGAIKAMMVMKEPQKPFTQLSKPPKGEK